MCLQYSNHVGNPQVFCGCNIKMRQHGNKGFLLAAILQVQLLSVQSTMNWPSGHTTWYLLPLSHVVLHNQLGCLAFSNLFIVLGQCCVVHVSFCPFFLIFYHKLCPNHFIHIDYVLCPGWQYLAIPAFTHIIQQHITLKLGFIVWPTPTCRIDIFHEGVNFYWHVFEGVYS